MRNTQFENNEYYHLYNRGTDKREIFLNNLDRYRFLLGLCSFNETERLSNKSLSSLPIEIGPSINPIIKIHAYCLMDNHFHLLVEQIQDQGISKFMHRLGTGYTNYFNIKHARTGSLFEGPFKARHISTTEYLLELCRYVHLNPIKYIKEKNQKKILEFAKNYQWSSFKNYISKNASSFVSTEKIFESFSSIRNFQIFHKEKLDHKLELSSSL